MQSRGCTKDSASIRFIFDRRTKPRGPIKEDWCSYAIGQDPSDCSRLHTIFATENDWRLRSKRFRKRTEASSIGFSGAKDAFAYRHRGTIHFGRKSAKNGETGAVHRLPWFEAAINETPSD